MPAHRWFALTGLLLAVLAGCQRADGVAPDSAPDPLGPASTSAGSAAGTAAGAKSGTRAEPNASDSAQAAAAAVAPLPPRVVFLGDSLTAGYGLDVDAAWPSELGRLLAEEGRPITVVNAGVSGDTSAGGLARTAWALRGGADILVVCLGGNDGLRGQPPASTAANLRSIITQGREAGARVLLVGVQMPPNYGPDYLREFTAIFPALAEETGVDLVPSLLEGVGGRRELNLADGIHPNAEGHRKVAAHVLPHLRKLLKSL